MSSITFPIEKFFPKENYRAACKNNPSLVPIYLIALRQPEETILAQYQTKDPQFTEPQFGLTALAVAIMVKSHNIVSYLLKDQKVAHSPRDRADLTPLHYACALQDTKSIELLQEAAGVRHILDIFTIFPDWKKIIQPQIPVDQDTVIHYKESSGNLVPLRANQFQELTGARFYDGVIASPQEFVNLLAQRLEQKPFRADNVLTALIHHSKIQFEKSRELPLRVYIAPQGIAGNGVFAKEDLPIGSYIGIYGGEIDFASQKKKTSFSSQDYQFKHFNGMKIRNAITMVNDGFPNCIALPMELSDGISYTIFIALEDIKKDEPLLVDYSIRHNAKVRKVRKEFNLEKMERYFQKFPPTKSLNLFKKLASGEQKLENTMSSTVEITGRIRRFQYLFHTPTALYTLFIKGILTKEQLLPLQRDDHFYSWIEANSPEFPSFKPLLASYFMHIQELDRLFQNKNLKVEKIRSILLGYLEQFSFRTFSLFCAQLTGLFFPFSELDKEGLNPFTPWLEGVEFMYSLFDLSPESPIDQKVFEENAKKIRSLPLSAFSVRLYFLNTAKQSAPHLIPHFETLFSTEAKAIESLMQEMSMTV